MPLVNLRAFATSQADNGDGLTAMDTAPTALAALVRPYAAIAERTAALSEEAPSLDEAAIATAEQEVLHAAAGLRLSEVLAAQTAAVLRREAIAVAAPETDTDRTVQVTVRAIGFEKGQYGAGTLALHLIAHAHLKTDREVITRPFMYRSSERPIAAWTEQGIAAELLAAEQTLGERIVDELFLRGPVNAALGTSCGPQALAPSRLYQPQTGATPVLWNRFTKVDSLQPVLKWESFETLAARAGIPRIWLQARYDLRVWEASDDAVPQLVYEQRGLAGNEHTIATALKPNARYYWSVRARYATADGLQHTTAWGRHRLPYASVPALLRYENAQGMPVLVRDPCQVDFVAEPNYYRFATPVESPHL